MLRLWPVLTILGAYLATAGWVTYKGWTEEPPDRAGFIVVGAFVWLWILAGCAAFLWGTRASASGYAWVARFAGWLALALGCLPLLTGTVVLGPLVVGLALFLIAPAERRRS